MIIEHSFTTFRIDISFKDADVDMVYKEARAAGVSTPVPHILCGPDNHKCTNDKTPTSLSVDFCMLKIWPDDPDITRESKALEKLGVKVMQAHGLIMGTCYMIFEIDAEKYSPELVQKVIDLVNRVFGKYLRYHKKGA